MAFGPSKGRNRGYGKTRFAYNGRFHEFIKELDYDFWEWIYDIGNETPWRIRGYLVGLQMASEQLKDAETIAQ